jgi:hypothetical protein
MVVLLSLFTDELNEASKAYATWPQLQVTCTWTLSVYGLLWFWMWFLPQGLMCWRLGPQCGHIEVVETLRGERSGL